MCEAVRQFGTREWKLVSNRLPRRTSDKCRDRWKLLNTSKGLIISGYWSKEEDEQLKQQVMQYGGWAEDGLRTGAGTASNLPWNKIATAIVSGSKTGSECRHRWRKVLFRTVNTLPWTEDEDKFILERMKIDKGLHVKQLTDCLSGRTAEAIVKRYEELTGLCYKDFFTEAEDEKLVQALRAFQRLKQKVSWVAVAKQVGSKTSLQCCCHWNVIGKHYPDIMKDKDVLFPKRLKHKY